jgi:hypothetical protein
MGEEKPICECVECQGKSNKLYKVKLTEEFDNDECIWCEDCLFSNLDMVEDYEELKEA